MEPAARDALVEYLRSLGATDADLASVPESDLPRLPFELKLWPTRQRLTLAEVAARAGVDPDFVLHAWHVFGFATPGPRDRVFVPEDVEMFGLLLGAIEVFGEDVVWQLGRVFGSSAARMADAAVSSFVVSFGAIALASADGVLALARANTQAAEFIPGVVRGVDVLLRHHLEAARRPVQELDVTGVEVQRRSVGFADIVDSTGLAERLSMAELSHALGEFDATAAEVIARHGGRIVKLLGDGVMFIATEASVGVLIALDLLEAFADHPVLPPIRTAVATGDVIARDGDYFGVVVNRAARAGSVAVPGSLLVDDETAEAVRDADGLRVRHAGGFRLKGFAERVHLYRVRRLD